MIIDFRVWVEKVEIYVNLGLLGVNVRNIFRFEKRTWWTHDIRIRILVLCCGLLALSHSYRLREKKENESTKGGCGVVSITVGSGSGPRVLSVVCL